jgi:Fe-S oxidoreductase
MVTSIFTPGCALMLYKPNLAKRLHKLLNENISPMEMSLLCCKDIPPMAPGTQVINICPGCDRRYRENYEDSGTISLWEVLVENSFLSLPDFDGREMTIIDACPTRDQTRVHDAVRILAKRMNIALIEPKNTRTKSTCCGDSCYGSIPTVKVVEQMKKKASQMPADEVLVYCVSCAKAMFIGGKRPRYMIDLLFNEETIPETVDLDKWHQELDVFKERHSELL